MSVITFFSNRGGVGKTTLVYHLSYMLGELNKRVVVLDLDPQSDITIKFLGQERLAEIVENGSNNLLTVPDCIIQLTEGRKYQAVHIEEINSNIGLVPGSLALSTCEHTLNEAWINCLNKDAHAFNVVTVFRKLIEDVKERWEADIVLIDLGPTLGVLNKTIIFNSENLILPLAPDLFSLQGIENLGKMLKIWRSEWDIRNELNSSPETQSASENIRFLGYIILQYRAITGLPAGRYSNWAAAFSSLYCKWIMNDAKRNIEMKDDPNCIGLLQHHYSLAHISAETGKPIFLLNPADGAIGAHMTAVNKSYEDIKKVTEEILRRIN